MKNYTFARIACEGCGKHTTVPFEDSTFNPFIAWCPWCGRENHVSDEFPEALVRLHGAIVATGVV